MKAFKPAPEYVWWRMREVRKKQEQKYQQQQQWKQTSEIKKKNKQKKDTNGTATLFDCFDLYMFLNCTLIISADP